MAGNSGLLIRLSAILLALSLLWGTAFAAADDGSVALYESSFAGETDGWYTSGAEDEVYATKQKTLGVRGRTDDWNGPRRDFTLEKGVKYHVEAEVLQKGEAAAVFMLTAAHSEDGGTDYRTLTQFEAARKKWTKLSCDWTAWVSGTFTLYVETAGFPKLEFEIRKVSVSRAPDEAESMVLSYRNKFAKNAEKIAAQLKKLPFPDIVKAAGTDAAAWIPELERSETAKLTETTVEGKTISVTTSREVSSFYWLETFGDGNFVGDGQTMHSDRSSFTVKDLDDRIALFVREARVEGRKDYDCDQTYLYDPATGSMALSETGDVYTMTGSAISPYDTIKKAQAWLIVTSRGDGSLSDVEWDLVGADVKYTLQAKARIGEDGRPDRFVFVRRGESGKGRYEADVTTDGDLKPVSLVWYVENGDNYLKAEVYQPDPSDPNDYYLPVILESYTKAQLEEPGAVMWAYGLDFGKGYDIQYFLTKDDLLVSDENGSVSLNADARDVKGKAFPAMGIAPLIDPELFILP